MVPTLSSIEAKKFFAEDIEAWKNFARRITKNPFVKNFLSERDGNQCSWCNKNLSNNVTVHHHSYLHACTFNVTKKVISLKRTRTVPDCEQCKRQDEQRFLTCMNKLSLVHPMCNKNIENKRQESILSA